MKCSLLSTQAIALALLLCAQISNTYASSEGGNGSAFFAIDTPFVVNLAGKDTLTYLQVNVQLKLKKPEYRAQLQSQMPAIQHTMMMLLSDQTIKSINSVQGKQALRETALKSLQELCQKLIGNPAIDDIYFTGFVIQ
jgi:flagellar FliL protein